MRADEAAYAERLKRAGRRLRELAERARMFADRLPAIERLVEERNRLSVDRAEERARRGELNREIGAFYAAWRELVAEARPAVGALAGLLPAHEVEDWVARMSEMAVGPTVEALEAVVRRLEEFGQAARPNRASAAQRAAERQAAPVRAGRWVTAAEYAAYTGVSVQTLANWRWQDRKADREGPGPGKPLYRRFGRAIRYLLPEQG